jgi:murein DD-endopeptidase MepM/ murein hydrolase activator NlpD
MNSNFENFLIQYPEITVLKTNFDSDIYVSLDLSIDNHELKTFDIHDIPSFENYWKSKVSSHGGNIAFGGYFEQRNLYRRSELFEESAENRDIHIGLDLWADAETIVLAAFDGEVYVSHFNEGIGNYGGTIILKHQIDNFEFYTLYGHLSIKSLEKMPKGTIVSQKQQLASLGFPNENGGYAAHLHFQIILDLEKNTEDYPGVCSSSKASFYKQNCPDPNLLLKLKCRSKTETMNKTNQ